MTLIKNLFLEHWRSGLIGALLTVFAVLLLATSRPAFYEAAVEFRILPKRVDSAVQGPFARQPVLPFEARDQFLEFLNGDEFATWMSFRTDSDAKPANLSTRTLRRIRNKISLEPVDSSGAMRVWVDDRIAYRAAWVAESVVDAYRNYLADQEQNRRAEDLEFWKEKLAQQERKINALREAILSFNRMRLAAIDNYGGEEREDWRQAVLFQQTNTRIGALKERFDALSGLDLDVFLEKANRLKLIDESLMGLVTNYFDERGTMRALNESGLSKNHVEVLAAGRRYQAARSVLETEVTKLLGELNQEVVEAEQSRAAMLAEREETWSLMGEIADRLEETQVLYEEETKELSETQAQVYTSQLEVAMPVDVVDASEGGAAAVSSVKPSVVVDLFLAPVLGLMTGVLVMLLVAWRRDPAGKPEAAASEESPVTPDWEGSVLAGGGVYAPVS